MKNFMKLNFFYNKVFLAVVVLISLLFNTFVLTNNVNSAIAATNLIKGGSFENNIQDDWSLWQSTDSIRDYELFRSYDAPFGNGSYSASIEAIGASEESWYAGLSNQKNFIVDSTKSYFLIFYAKSTVGQDLSMFLQNADSYVAISAIETVNINTTWEKHTVVLNPTSSVLSALTFSFGNMSDGNIISIDGARLIENNITLSTNEIKGYIGDNKFIKLSGADNFEESDIDVEIPYYDNDTSEQTTKIFNPSRLTRNGFYLDVEKQTFSGVATIYINNSQIGQFNYNVTPRITSYFPKLVRADEDLTIVGNGFHPGLIDDRTYIILNTIDVDGKKSETWVRPHIIDSSLTQITATLPLGVTVGSMYVNTTFLDRDYNTVRNKSNNYKYGVKPVIYSLEWSDRGYEQVGDNLKIYGKGISSRPYVNFYDDNGNKIETIKAKAIEIFNDEIIEVKTSKKLNQFNVTVTSGGIESDDSSALNYLAKPMLSSIKSNNSRNILSSDEVIAATKVGEEITLYGEGFMSDNATTTVEFQGLNQRVYVDVDPLNIDDRSGKWLKVVVPQGALNGYINFLVNGETSNYLPIEIIPTVITVNPDPVVPGQTMWINANGVGTNMALTKVHFNLNNNTSIEASPFTLENYSGEAVIHVRVPMAVSSEYSSINLQYDRWKDNETTVLNTEPYITSASINLDDKILSIKGYGFSIHGNENIITYKYADEDRTVINPDVKMLGVYPTEEGQEIRILIKDNYHYGYVSVGVGSYESNEVNFGPASVSNIARRIEYVQSDSAVRGVLYINGYNFGPTGDVWVGSQLADVHYRSNFFIIAVVDEQYVYDNPVVVTR